MTNNIESSKSKVNDSKVEEVVNVVVPEERKAPVTQEAKEQTNKLKSEVVTQGLPDDAYELALKSLGLSDPIDSTFRIKLTKYQKDHNISIDDRNPMVGPETYAEMKAGYVLENMKDNDNIDSIISNLNDINWEKLNEKGLNAILLGYSLKNLKNNNEFNKKIKTNSALYIFISKFEDKQEKYKTSPEGQKAIKQAKTKMTDLYEVVNNPSVENIKNFVKDPTLLLAAGLMFLFGVGTDISFMNRLGILLGGMVFGPYVMKKFGIDKFFDAGENAVKKSAKDGVLKTIADKTKEVSKKVSTYFKEGEYKSFFDFVPDLGNEISEAFSKTVSSIGRYNETLKNVEGGKNYIEPEKLGVFQNNVMGDSKFGNTSKEELGKISTINDLFNYVGADTQKAITDSLITDKEVTSFIKKHLLENQFGANTDSKIVKDLFFTTAIYDKMKLAIVKHGEYVKDDELNKKIIDKISLLTNSTDRKQQNLGLSLALAITTGKLDEFKLESFGVDSTTKVEIDTLLKSIEKYEVVKAEIKLKINELKSINITLNGTESEEVKKTIFQNVLNGVDKISLDSSKISGFETTKFNNAKNEKIKEILEKARANGLGAVEFTIGTEIIKVDKYFDKIEKQEKAKIFNELKTFNKNIDTLTSKLPKIIENKLNIAKYQEYKKQVDDIFKQIEIESEITILITDFKLFINNTTDSNFFNVTKKLSPLEKEKKEKINKLLKIIKEKYLELENFFDTDVFGLDNTELLQKQAIIRDFSNSYKKLKKEKFKNSINEKINIPFINSLKNLNKISDLINLKKEYMVFVNGLSDDLVGESFKKAYEERINKIENKEKNNRRISEIPGLKNDIVKLITIYKDAIGITAFNKLDTEKTIIEVLKNTLISFKNLNKDNKDLVNDINKILNKIK